jgi:hypothetical protein
MTSYKNFTTAMASKGFKLKMNEMRNGFCERSDGTLAGFAAKKTGAEGDLIAEQRFESNGQVFVSVIRVKKANPVWTKTIESQSPVYIFTGGQFEETFTTIKRVKNKNGPGYFQQPVMSTKIHNGVKEAGEFLLESVKQVGDSFELIFKKIT